MTEGTTSWAGVSQMIPTRRDLGVGYLAAIGLMLFGFSFYELVVLFGRSGLRDVDSFVVLVTGLFLAGTLLSFSLWLYRKPLSDEHTLAVSKWGALGLTVPTGVVVVAVALDGTAVIQSGQFTAALGASGVVGSLYGTVTALEAERERVDKLYQRNQVLQRVFRHNIRNGMNVVQVYSQLLSDHLGDENEGLARKIEREARSVVDLADIARDLETIETADDRTPVNLAAVVSELCETLGEYYPAVSIEMDLPEEMWVQADSAVEVAVWNLIEFAIHRSSDAPVTVALTQQEESVVLTVADQGEPLAEEALTVLERGTEAPLEHLDGIDLWVVKWLFETLGAELTIDNNDSTGMQANVVFEAQTVRDTRET